MKKKKRLLQPEDVYVRLKQIAFFRLSLLLYSIPFTLLKATSFSFLLSLSPIVAQSLDAQTSDENPYTVLREIATER